MEDWHIANRLAEERDYETLWQARIEEIELADHIEWYETKPVSWFWRNPF
jgi:hypothetical protein